MVPLLLTEGAPISITSCRDGMRPSSNLQNDVLLKADERRHTGCGKQAVCHTAEFSDFFFKSQKLPIGSRARFARMVRGHSFLGCERETAFSEWISLSEVSKPFFL